MGWCMMLAGAPQASAALVRDGREVRTRDLQSRRELVARADGEHRVLFLVLVRTGIDLVSVGPLHRRDGDTRLVPLKFLGHVLRGPEHDPRTLTNERGPLLGCLLFAHGPSHRVDLRGRCSCWRRLQRGVRSALRAWRHGTVSLLTGSTFGRLKGG